jgi:outer membrane receptor protein involved in Fe transport
MRQRVLPAAMLLCAAAMSAQELSPAKPVQQSVTVTADRGLAGVNDSATSVAVLSQQQMQRAPGLTLDDKLHSVAGFQLFRRTSSWTANPTTEGVSLRGLGSTAASRTLVVSDQVPLNDPFGGWIHWDEIPSLAIQQVDLLRGGSADLYGSSAIGGVVDVVPVMPGPKFEFKVDALGATENSALEDALLAGTTRFGSMLGAFTGLTTGGYITTAPALRGSVDVPSNVSEESGRVVLRSPPQFKALHGFLLGNVLNETRSNGTADQTNGTRLWRYVGGVDAEESYGHGALRLYGSRESYRQSFSSIAADRDSETMTRQQHVPLDEVGFVLQGSRALHRELTVAIGVDLRDIRATDNETVVSTTTTTSTSARQREVGGYADAIWQPHGWSFSGSIRVDSFRTFDARQIVSSTKKTTALPELDELFAGPRVGVVRQLPKGFALTGTAFRAFRGPTMNELYRTGQVGQQTTLANNSLLAERATGFEFGGEVQWRAARVRATYFWTEVNRPISAVLLSQTPPLPAPPTAQTLQRQNLGQIRSEGMMVEAQSETWRGVDASFGYQLAFATVTAFNASSAVQPDLLGNWIPEVPRQSLTATANYVAPRIASFHAIASYTGHVFDDAANQFVLHPYARFDVSAERSLPHGLSVFAGAQNVLNRTIDAGRTPILTLAAPRLVQAGLRYSFPR